MSKLLAALVAGLFAMGAYAQNPNGTSAEQGNATNSAGQHKAQAKVESKPQGAVKQAGGDTLKTPEGGAAPSGKAVDAGEKRQSTRDARYQKRKGKVARKSTQGGTPDMATAK
jgi:hypothetical protein